MNDVLTIVQAIGIGQNRLAVFNETDLHQFDFQIGTGQTVDDLIRSAGTGQKVVGRIDDRLSFDISYIVSAYL